MRVCKGGQISEVGDKFPRKFGPPGAIFPRKFGPGGGEGANFRGGQISCDTGRRQICGFVDWGRLGQSCIFHESTSVGNQGVLLLVWVYSGGPALVHRTMEIRQLPGHTLSEHCSAETVPAVGVVILIKELDVSGRSKRMGPKGTIFEYAQRKSN